MEEMKLADELNDCKVNSFDVNQMTVITSIKNGNATIDAIETDTGIKAIFIENILDTLEKQRIVAKIHNSKSTKYMLHKHVIKNKPIRLSGNLLLPVSSFVDKDGQKWVTRGAWHKIDSNVDIINDIEWVAEDNNADQMKLIMRQITEHNKRMNGDTPENMIAYKGKVYEFGNSKIRIKKIGRENSLVSHTFTCTHNEIDFPWPSDVPFTISNDELVDMIESNTFKMKFTLHDMIKSCKKIIAFCSIDGDELSFIDVYNKKSAYYVDMKKFKFSTKKLIDVSIGLKYSFEGVTELLTNEATITNNLINQL